MKCYTNYQHQTQKKKRKEKIMNMRHICGVCIVQIFLILYDVILQTKNPKMPKIGQTQASVLSGKYCAGYAIEVS